MNPNETINKWLDEHKAEYITLPYHHVQKAHYLIAGEYEKLNAFPSRVEAIDDYLKDKYEKIKQACFDEKMITLSTMATLKVPLLDEYIKGEDIIGAINNNIYNAHGVQGQVLTTDVEDDAFEFLDSAVKNLVATFMTRFKIKTHVHIMCHPRQHAMGTEEMQDFLLKYETKKKLASNE